VIEQTLERLFFTLASDLGYSLSRDEYRTYVGELKDFGLNKICEAVLDMHNRDYPAGMFPSVAEFKKVIGDQI